MSEKHTAFYRGFLWGALAMAIGVGFSIGGHLSFVLGFGFPIRPAFASFLQAHGHVQLVGWSGLLIMGVSLHFLPRLAGRPIIHAHRIPWILRLLLGGLVLRTIGQTVSPYVTSHPWFTLLTGMTVLSGLLEWGGIVLYIQTILGTLRSRTTPLRPALRMVKPYFLAMLCGWGLYACLNLALLVQMGRQGAMVLHGPWNHFAIQGFIDFVLLPVAFAFSVRLFPLYLRLPAPSSTVGTTAWAYVVSAALAVLPTAPPFVKAAPEVATICTEVGTLLKGGIILWFVWCLDVLTRCQLPWTARVDPLAKAARRPTRPGLPDYGDFGRFERLIYSAYGWLTLAAGAEIVHGIAALVGVPAMISNDVLRHMYLLGFISLLIFGVTVRMIPGFLGQRRLAHPALVTATFWLGNAAVLGRVMGFIFPTALLELLPRAAALMQSAFALSGVLGLLAVLCLAVNLWRTARQG
jgi:uncharacterized protein involved in response to NO